MDKYEVMHLLGEGSFGRVYKAKQASTKTLVALKVISKRGRCAKELKGLRRECEIQRELHHPNIIQLLDSFETENEIVVITEFAYKELHALLAKKGVLVEGTVQKITWDLVSALYYLHSHRILHRDLKPQNVLLDIKNNAKVCDFGFARNLSTQTHFLTSIKGTPLYMAPELVDEQPYDHNADLWSLGCIIYELLEGAPPFRTTSILHLIELIRNEPIHWPTMVSEECNSFLKGLLQKNPKNRLSWPDILDHSFVKGHVIIAKDASQMALTRRLSQDFEHQKIPQSQQRRSEICVEIRTKEKDTGGGSKLTSRDMSKLDISKLQIESDPKSLSNVDLSKDQLDSQDLKNNNPPECQRKEGASKTESSTLALPIIEVEESGEKCLKNSAEHIEEKPYFQEKCDAASIIKEVEKSDAVVAKIEFIEHSYKIENEEWLAFLKKTFRELKSNGLSTFTQISMLDVVMSPLLNSSASPEVICLVAKIFCIPFVLAESHNSEVILLKKLYLEIKLVPNLVYAMHLLFRSRITDASSDDQNFSKCTTLRDLSDMTSEDLDCLEYICLAVNHFIHWNDCYVEQFCNAITTLNAFHIVRLLLLCSRLRLRIVIDTIACLTHILQVNASRHIIVDKILTLDPGRDHSRTLNINELLRHVNPLIRERMCYFLFYLGLVSPRVSSTLWSESAKKTLEALMYDSIDTVRIAAEKCFEVLKDKQFYVNERSENLQLSNNGNL